MLTGEYAGQEKAKQISTGLWGQAPLERAINVPGRDIFVAEDFTGFSNSLAVAANVGYYAGKSGAWKSYEDTSVSFTNIDQGGALKYLGTTTDNLEAAVQLEAVPFQFAASAGLKMWFETIISKETIAATAGVGFVCGLGITSLPANSFMDDAGAIIVTTAGFVGFSSFDATGDKIDFMYQKASTTPVTVKAGIALPVAATAIKLGWYYDGSTITPYINGVPTAATNIVSATAIAASNFPSATAMSPIFAVKQGTNVAKYVKNYGIYCLQTQ